MKQKGKKDGKGIVVLGVFLVGILLICVLAFNQDVLFGEKKSSIDENISQSGEKDSEKPNSENTSGDVYKELNVTKRVGDIEISNIRIELVEKNKCKVTTDVKNLSDKFLSPTNLSIKVINENGETEEVFGGIITELIREEENVFVTYIHADITDAYDIEFEIIDME